MSRCRGQIERRVDGVTADEPSKLIDESITDRLHSVSVRVDQSMRRFELRWSHCPAECRCGGWGWSICQSVKIGCPNLDSRVGIHATSLIDVDRQRFEPRCPAGNDSLAKLEKSTDSAGTDVRVRRNESQNVDDLCGEGMEERLDGLRFWSGRIRASRGEKGEIRRCLLDQQ